MVWACVCYELSENRATRGRTVVWEDTYVLGCDGVCVFFATHGAANISLLFDHGRSVAAAWRLESTEKQASAKFRRTILVTGYTSGVQ